MYELENIRRKRNGLAGSCSVNSFPLRSHAISYPFKTVGTRKPAADFITTVKFLETVVALRGAKPFIPKGVYRFKTHEEAQSWSERMMTRPRKKAGPWS